MVLFIATLYFVLLSWLATKNFKTAVGLLICALPSYFIRFNIGPLPTSALEITFGSIFLVWLLKYSRTDWQEIENFYQEHKFFSWITIAFLFFLVLVGQRKNIKSEDLIWFLCLSTVSISILAIIQKLTGRFYSPTLRPQDILDLHGRVTSFFTTPNAIGLYVAPIIPLVIYGFKKDKRKLAYLVIILLALVGIFLSFSEGAWIALALGAVLAIFLTGRKKTVGIIMALAILVAIFIVPLRQNLLFQNQSGHNRLVLWNYTWNYLDKSPKNFIFGAGIKEWFEKVQKPVNNFTKIEPLIFPHNTFLNFWSEIGLFGMVSFVLLYIYGLNEAIKKYRSNTSKFFGGAIICMLVIFLVHGLVDVPYFKNDLSFVWWILMAVIFI